MADRPAFAARFPEDPELDRLVVAFARGDYRAVRAGAARLAQEQGPAGASPEVRNAAHELVRRTEADPLAKALLALTFVLLVVLTAWWAGPPKPSPRAPESPVEHVH
jgi:hypothetical protein